MIKALLSVSMAFVFTVCLASATIARQNQDDEKYYKMSEVDVKAKILQKPIASARGCSESNGEVGLRVYLHKSGVVSKVEITDPSSCQKYDQRAIDAAKAIKFTPAVKDGVAVSTSVLVKQRWNRF